MFNWRARIGYVMPGEGAEIAPRDFWRMAPPGVSLVLTSAGMREIETNQVEAALASLRRCAETLRDHSADLVHIGGVPMVSFKGPDSAKELMEQVKSWSGGLPVTTAFQAQMNALRAFDADKVAMVSPNTTAVTETFRSSAEAVGVNVLHGECLNLPRNRTPLVPPNIIYHACTKAMHSSPEAKALWIPCGNFDVIDLIEALEADFGVPVVTNNQAFLWWVLSVLGLNCRQQITGFGQLFQVRCESVNLL